MLISTLLLSMVGFTDNAEILNRCALQQLRLNSNSIERLEITFPVGLRIDVWDSLEIVKFSDILLGQALTPSYQVPGARFGEYSVRFYSKSEFLGQLSFDTSDSTVSSRQCGFSLNWDDLTRLEEHFSDQLEKQDI